LEQGSRTNGGWGNATLIIAIHAPRGPNATSSGKKEKQENERVVFHDPERKSTGEIIQKRVEFHIFIKDGGHFRKKEGISLERNRFMSHESCQLTSSFSINLPGPWLIVERQGGFLTQVLPNHNLQVIILDLSNFHLPAPCLRQANTGRVGRFLPIRSRVQRQRKQLPNAAPTLSGPDVAWHTHNDGVSDSDERMQEKDGDGDFDRNGEGGVAVAIVGDAEIESKPIG
jgi:hypothetical protein